MAASMLLVLRRAGLYLTSIEKRLSLLLLGRNDHGEYGYEPVIIEDCIGETEARSSEWSSRSIVDDIFGNGFLWAVQRQRRTIERRRTRLRCPEKSLHPKNNLTMCTTCGHFHEFHTICGNCYEKVKAETKAIQERMKEEWKLDPIDKEVVVVYDNDEKNEEFWNGKRIVEMKRDRPQWFHKNLRIPTRSQSNDGASTKDLTKTIISHIK